MLSCDFRRMLAVALVVTITFVTMPLSAADFPTTAPVIGSISSVGSVELRGVGISQEETLFAGDNIRSHENGSANVVLETGSKIELAENTDVNVNSDKMGVKIAMNSGTVGFTASKPLRIDVLPFEVVASDNASGNVYFTGSNASIRATDGQVLVRNLKTAKSFVITKGHEGFIELTDGAHSVSLAEFASTTPGPIPAPQPQAQAPSGKKEVKGVGMDKGAWLAVIGGIVVAGVAGWALTQSIRDRDQIKDLRTQVHTLQGR
jgi:hypothetical protein